MNNLDDIKHILQQTPTIKPNNEIKKVSINNALEYFDKKTAKSFQGTANSHRPKSETKTVSQFLFGRDEMKQRNLIIAGVLTVCVIGGVALVPLYNKQVSFYDTQVSDSSVIALNTPQAEPEAFKRQATKPAVLSKDAYEADEELGRSLDMAKKERAEGAVAPAEMQIAKADVVAELEEAAEAKQVMENRPQAQIQPASPKIPKAKAEMADDARSNEVVAPSVVDADQQVAAQKALIQAARKEALLKAKKQQAERMSGVLGLDTVTQPAPDATTHSYQDQGRDKFEEIKPSPIKLAKEEPVSTFSIDVDTASYSFVRASLNRNVLPQKNAVRVEELVNYFPYQYPAPETKEQPFKTHVTVYPTPWNKETKLMHIGIKGYQLKNKPRANLVFLIDTSGSMRAPNKLPLLQASLKMLLDTLQDEDTVAIVTYAGNAGVALEPTKIKDKSKIISVINNLGAGGSTAGAEGIRQAYQLAEQHFNTNGVNRVILATDGDFNVGITNQNELKDFIERKRETGITLSVLGFGTGNYNDALMQALAQNGNGNAAYIDSLNEARKALVDEAGSTLFTIAKDVKIQVEFNPTQVAEYRLLGYETRALKREDFNNDKVDAGDIGAGHTVTALYEITPVGSKAKLVDDLRYQQETDKARETGNKTNEYAFVKIRYKLPDSDTSSLISAPVDAKNEYNKLEDVPTESRFATSVAAFAQLLRGEPYLKNFDYNQVIELAQQSKGEDKYGYRAEFINLVRIAKNASALPTNQ